MLDSVSFLCFSLCLRFCQGSQAHAGKVDAGASGPPYPRNLSSLGFRV